MKCYGYWSNVKNRTFCFCFYFTLENLQNSLVYILSNMYSEYGWKTAKSLKNLDRTTAVGWWYYKVVSFRYI